MSHPRGLKERNPEWFKPPDGMVKLRDSRAKDGNADLRKVVLKLRDKLRELEVQRGMFKDGEGLGPDAQRPSVHGEERTHGQTEHDQDQRLGNGSAAESANDE